MSRLDKAKAVLDALTACEKCQGYRNYYRIAERCACQEMWAEEDEYQRALEAEQEWARGYYSSDYDGIYEV